MELPRLSRYKPQNSKKRVFPGGSSRHVDPDTVEIPRPKSLTLPRSATVEEVVHHEVIDVDMDEDDEIKLIGGKVCTESNQKEPLSGHLLDLSSSAKLGAVDVVHSSKKSYLRGLQNIVNLDGWDSNNVQNTDMHYTDLSYEDIDYEVLQSHFDSMDIPPGVEASIPWWPNPAQNKMKPSASSGLKPSTSQQPNAVSVLPGKLSSSALCSHEPASKSSSSMNLSSSGGSVGNGGKVELFGETAPSNIKLAASSSSTGWSSQIQGIPINNFSGGVEPFESWHSSGSSYGKRTAFSSSTKYSNHHSYWDQMKVLPGIGPSNCNHLLPISPKKQADDGSQTHTINYMPMGAINPSDAGTAWHAWQSSFNKQSFMTDPFYSVFDDCFDAVHSFSLLEADTPVVQGPVNSQKSVTTSGSSQIPSGPSSGGELHPLGNEDIMTKFNLFKRFDVVQDYSDHHFACNSLKGEQSKNWAKKIQEEWRILENNLPDTIFVRVYESRMDLLRAVIVGAEGTPYHDGLFFFDALFPSTYPKVPPCVHYHSGGHRINPNLYNCGKVCLSLLNTWDGSAREKWLPGVSTMLQVLVSIQGLILNAKPYFNEPGYAVTFNSPQGEKSSQSYNENTFILSLKTMVCSMRRPPKHFEDLVVGHFCKHAQDILVACKAYMDGAQVGCLVKGGVQDVDEGDKSCSDNFKRNLAQYINTLVNAFTQIGAKDCEKFLSLAEKAKGATLGCSCAYK